MVLKSIIQGCTLWPIYIKTSYSFIYIIKFISYFLTLSTYTVCNVVFCLHCYINLKNEWNTHFSFRFDWFHVSLSQLSDSFTSPKFSAHNCVAHGHYSQRNYISEAQKYNVISVKWTNVRNIGIWSTSHLRLFKVMGNDKLKENKTPTFM